MKRNYLSTVSRVKEVQNWRPFFEVCLGDNIDFVRDMAKGCKDASLVSIDIETTSLSPVDAKLVGFSVSSEMKRSYYIPLAHRIGNNAPFEEAVEVLKEIMYGAKKVLFYNYRYDMRILRKYGVDPFRVNHFDTQCLMWNLDTNIALPGLKDCVLQYLGIRLKSFEDVVQKGNGVDFSYLPSEDALEYAAFDAQMTLLLYRRFESFYKEVKFIVDMDNELERAIMFFEENPVCINKDYAKKIGEIYRKKSDDVKEKIYRTSGVSFDIESPAQVLQVLHGVGVPLETKTAKGKFSTQEAAIKKFAGKYPIVDLVLKYREYQKAINTYVDPFLNSASDRAYIKYITKNVPSGRLASGGKSQKQTGTEFFIPINVQSTILPNTASYRAFPVNNNEGILGYDFELDRNGCVEGYEEDNVRRIFEPHPGHYIVDIDYDLEEIVIAANLSGDRAFLDPLVKGEDVHKSTAIKVFGEESYNKEKRRIAKLLNYASLYYGNEYTLKRLLEGKTVEECFEYYKLWKNAHHTYLRYMAECCSFAKKNGYVKSPMGRIRRVAFWYGSYAKEDISYANRTVANSQVQGCAADIMRYVLIRIFREMFLDPQYKEKVFFMASMHDELVFSVTKQEPFFTEIVKKIIYYMTDLPFDWEKKLTVSVKVGTSWGRVFPFVHEGERWQVVRN